MRIISSLKSFQFVFAGLLLSLSIGGCGESHSATANPSGIFVDSTTGDFLKRAFDETKECTAFKDGTFEDINIVLMPPTFPCKYYTDGCSGEYVTPNSIKVGSLYTWRHEVVHYLLTMNTGDPDAAHKSPLFDTCV